MFQFIIMILIPGKNTFLRWKNYHNTVAVSLRHSPTHNALGLDGLKLLRNSSDTHMHAGWSVCVPRARSFQRLREGPQRSPRQSGWGQPLLMRWRTLLLLPGGAGWSAAGSRGQRGEQRRLGMSWKRRRRERKGNLIGFSRKGQNQTWGKQIWSYTHTQTEFLTFQPGRGAQHP